MVKWGKSCCQFDNLLSLKLILEILIKFCSLVMIISLQWWICRQFWILLYADIYNTCLEDICQQWKWPHWELCQLEWVLNSLTWQCRRWEGRRGRDCKTEYFKKGRDRGGRLTSRILDLPYHPSPLPPPHHVRDQFCCLGPHYTHTILCRVSVLYLGEETHSWRPT